MKILYTEWLKIKSYWAFWLMMLMMALVYPGINYMFYNEYKQMLTSKNTTGQIMQMLVGNPFELPETFHTTSYFSSIFVFIPAIVVIMLVTNEFTYRTSRQNIIDGWSREKFLLGKLFDVAIITLVVSILYAIFATIVGKIATDKVVAAPWSQIKYNGYFALQTFSQLSIAFLIGFLVRRSFIALGTFVFYYIILENIIVAYAGFKKWPWGKYMPLEISDRMIPPPKFMARFDEAGYKLKMAEIGPHVWYTILLTIAVWALCYYINKKRDL